MKDRIGVILRTILFAGATLAILTGCYSSQVSIFFPADRAWPINNGLTFSYTTTGEQGIKEDLVRVDRGPDGYMLFSLTENKSLYRSVFFYPITETPEDGDFFVTLGPESKTFGFAWRVSRSPERWTWNSFASQSKLRAGLRDAPKGANWLVSQACKGEDSPYMTCSVRTRAEIVRLYRAYIYPDFLAGRPIAEGVAVLAGTGNRPPPPPVTVSSSNVSATPGTKLALVVAFSRYQKLPPLLQTYPDARRMTSALSSAGFTVTTVMDERGPTDAASMWRSINAFRDRLRAAGPRAIGFFYFSGHGASLEDRGDNYLIPSAADIRNPEDLRATSLKLAEVLSELRRGGGQALYVSIDACRDVLLPGAKSLRRGFAQELAPDNTLVAFSAAPGRFALDNGYYSEELAAQLRSPGLEAAQIFIETSRRIGQRTNSQQQPRIELGYLPPIYFTPSR